MGIVNFDRFMITKKDANNIMDLAATDDTLMKLLISLEENSDDFGIQDMYLNKILKYVDNKMKNGLH